jgi:hypothetical protein
VPGADILWSQALGLLGNRSNVDAKLLHQCRVAQREALLPPFHRRGKKPAMAITSVLLSLRVPAMAATAGAAALLVAWLLPGAGPVR